MECDRVLGDGAGRHRSRHHERAHGSGGTNAGGDAAHHPGLAALERPYRPGFTWTSHSRIVIAPPKASLLRADGETFAADLAALTGGHAPAVVDGSTTSPVPGDIVLTVQPNDPQLPQEGYTLDIGPILHIGARTNTGAFWATRTVLQLLKQDRTLGAGSARDWPRYRTRSVLVDTGGRTFPMSWWSNLIRNLSYFKMNQLTFASNFVGLTPAQERQVEQLATSYHVALLPEVNNPAHMNYSNDISAVPEQYQLFDDNGAPADSLHGSIDVTDPAAVAWAHTQIVNNVERFRQTSTWAIGGDEWPHFGLNLINPGSNWSGLQDRTHRELGQQATLADLYKHYINGVDDLLKAHGMTNSMWNDRLYPSSVVKLHSDITVQDWVNVPGTLTPAQIAANGNQLVNAD